MSFLSRYFRKFSNSTQFIPKPNTVKLAFVSDIHLENRYDLVPKLYSVPEIHLSDYHGIALIGDIGNPFDNNYTQFLYNCSNQFKNVYLLSGNHEYYHKSRHINYLKSFVDNQIIDVINHINDIVGNKNIIYLNNSVADIDGTNHRLIGSTLWSHYNVYSKGKNTPEYIIKFNNFVNRQHFESKRQIEIEINKSKLLEKDITVLTHYMSTIELVHDKYMKYIKPSYYEYEDQNRYYTDLEYLFGDPVKYWLCGHSHLNIEKEINGTKLKMNAQPNKRKHNIPLSYIEIDV
jgi:hypothetical protein